MRLCFPAPRQVARAGYADGASTRNDALGVWWPKSVFGGDPASDYSVRSLETEDAPKWRTVFLPSVFNVTLKSTSAGRLDME